MVGNVLVPDTNVLLEHKDEFRLIPWSAIAEAGARGPTHVVIPILVIDELDKAKSDRARSRARACLRDINTFITDPLAPSAVVDDSGRSVTLHLLLDKPAHVRLSDPDMEIATRALALGDLVGFPTRVVTFDTGMALRSRAMGLDVIHLGAAVRR